MNMSYSPFNMDLQTDLVYGKICQTILFFMRDVYHRSYFHLMDQANTIGAGCLTVAMQTEILYRCYNFR